MTTDIPYYLNGKLLLQSTDGLWYFLDVGINNATPYIRIAQDPTVIVGINPLSPVTILGSDGNFYNISLQTIAGIVYVSIVATAATSVFIVNLLGDDGNTYGLRAIYYNGQIYIELVSSTIIGIFNLPWRGIIIASEDITKKRSIVPVNAKTFTTVLVPT